MYFCIIAQVIRKHKICFEAHRALLSSLSFMAERLFFNLPQTIKWHVKLHWRKLWALDKYLFFLEYQLTNYVVVTACSQKLKQTTDVTIKMVLSSTTTYKITSFPFSSRRNSVTNLKEQYKFYIYQVQPSTTFLL